MTSPIEELREAAEAERRARDRQTALVVQLRAAGTSWRTIGNAVGLTRTGAHRKWGTKQHDIEQLPLSDPLFDPLFNTPKE